MSKQAGKGDKPRPTNKDLYNANYDLINWNHSEKKQKVRTSKKNCP